MKSAPASLLLVIALLCHAHGRPVPVQPASSRSLTTPDVIGLLEGRYERAAPPTGIAQCSPTTAIRNITEHEPGPAWSMPLAGTAFEESVICSHLDFSTEFVILVERPGYGLRGVMLCSSLFVYVTTAANATGVNADGTAQTALTVSVTTLTGAPLGNCEYVRAHGF